MDLRAQSAARRWPHQRVLSREFAPRQFEYSPFFDDVIVCGTTQSEVRARGVLRTLSARSNVVRDGRLTKRPQRAQVLLVDHDHGTPLAYHSFVGKRRVDPILGALTVHHFLTKTASLTSSDVGFAEQACAGSTPGRTGL